MAEAPIGTIWSPSERIANAFGKWNEQLAAFRQGFDPMMPKNPV